MSNECPNCGGTGKEKCWNCEGTGGTWKEVGDKTDWEKCPLCWGDGVNSCINCDGTGKSEQSKIAAIK